jgi:hypothetical protein
VAKPKKQKFPETLQVRYDIDCDFLAYGDIEGAVDDDGPTDVAEYKLVRVRKFRKEVVECSPK